MPDTLAVGISTVGQLLSLYQQEYLPLKAPGTQKQQQYVFRVIDATLGDVALGDLTPARLRAWKVDLGQGRKPGTVRQYMDTLSAALRIAVEHYDLLPTNPLRKVAKPPEAPGRVRYLSLEEQHRLLAACQQSRQPALYPLVLLALSTGTRRSEVSRLRWTQLDLERGMLRLPQTKNGERRPVPIPHHARVVMAAWRAQQAPEVAWVFPRADGRGPLRAEHAWQGALKRAKVDDFKFHDLRHSFASYMALSGARLEDIADVLGHKSLAVTRRYRHVTLSHTAGIVERMADMFLTEEGHKTE